MQNTSSHRLPLILAISLHVLLFFFLFVHFISADTRNLELQPDVDIIKAVAVTPADVTAQITQIKAQEQAALELQQQQEQQQRAAAEAAERQKQAAIAAQQAAQQAAQKQAETEALLAEQAAEQKVLQQKVVEAKKVEDPKKTAEVKAVTQKSEKTKPDEAKKLQAKKDADKKKQQQKVAQELKLAQQKELESQMAAEQKQLEAARTAKNQSEIEKYTALILHTMRQNWIVPDSLNPEMSCQLAIKLKSDGTVVSVTVIRSSGNAALDNSAKMAVYKSSPLPVPADKELFNNTFSQFNLTVSKKDA